jgi:hypothetical protein
VRPVCWRMFAVALCATAAGILGSYKGEGKGEVPDGLISSLPTEKHRIFLADW